MLRLDSATTATSPLEPLQRVLRESGETALVLFADHFAREGPIVAAVDRTSGSRPVARTAKTLADELGDEVVLAHVRRPESIRTPRDARRRRRALEKVAANARRVTGDRPVEVLEGDPVARLLAYADERGARLLITSSATGGADEWLAAGLAYGVSFPVVVVSAEPRPDQMQPRPHGRGPAARPG